MNELPGRQLALGTAQWGMRYGIANSRGQPDREELMGILDLAESAGVTTIDTARAYGTSEAAVGELCARGHWRIMTKLDPDVYRAGMQWPESQALVQQSLAASRRALRAETLNTVLLHRLAHRTVLSGSIWSVLKEEQQAGRIGRLGVSADSVDAAWLAIGDPDIEVVQVAASLLDQRLWRAGFFERASETGVEVVVRSVFLQGVAFLPPDGLPAQLAPLAQPLKRIRDWAREREASTESVFLHFLRETVPATLLVGCETAEQLRAHVQSWTSASPPDIRFVADLVPELDNSVLSPAAWNLDAQSVKSPTC